MKIAISSEGPDLEAKVSHRLGTSKYLLIMDLKSKSVEAMPSPANWAQSKGGMQVVAFAISKKVDAVLTGYCGPVAESYLLSKGIEVITGLSGTAGQAVKDYMRGAYQERRQIERKTEPGNFMPDKDAIINAFRRSKNQFFNLLPILIGVILLIGLFNAFISKDILSFIFSGNKIWDLLWGTICGSILAGNPINSYIIGGELLEYGISLLAVTAFIMAWVTVGLIQLPAEIAALGLRFALVRNAISFILSMVIAIITVIILKSMTG